MDGRFVDWIARTTFNFAEIVLGVNRAGQDYNSVPAIVHFLSTERNQRLCRLPAPLPSSVLAEINFRIPSLSTRHAVSIRVSTKQNYARDNPLTGLMTVANK